MTYYPRMIVGTKTNRMGLDDVNPQALLECCQEALNQLECGTQSLLDGDLRQAMKRFFKAATMAESVRFAAKTNGIELPGDCLEKMCQVTDHATCGIKKVMKAIACKKILSHQRLYHGSPQAAVAGLAFGDDPSWGAFVTSEAAGRPGAEEAWEELVEQTRSREAREPFRAATPVTPMDILLKQHAPEAKFFESGTPVALSVLFKDAGVQSRDMWITGQGVWVRGASAKRATRALDRIVRRASGMAGEYIF